MAVTRARTMVHVTQTYRMPLHAHVNQATVEPCVRVRVCVIDFELSHKFIISHHSLSSQSNGLKRFKTNYFYHAMVNG